MHEAVRELKTTHSVEEIRASLRLMEIQQHPLLRVSMRFGHEKEAGFENRRVAKRILRPALQNIPTPWGGT